MVVYGLKNCDTCRKARKWLDAEGIEYTFRDLRDNPVERQDVARWLTSVGIDVLINKRGTTWRQLPEARKSVSNVEGYIDLMMQFPAIIKRPVFDLADDIVVGFGDKTYLRECAMRAQEPDRSLG